MSSYRGELRTETVTIEGAQYFGRLIGDQLKLYQIADDGELPIKGRRYADLAIKYLAALRQPS